MESIGDPLEYVKSEQLKKADEKNRIQPFLQSFWDNISQSISGLDQLNNFPLPNYKTDENGKQVLESKGEAKQSFFKLINNLFVGNGTITRALNPTNNPEILSLQSQLKSFYKQLCTQYIPESILNENGEIINQKEVDNNIFSNPELNIPKEYLEILSMLLAKLLEKYEQTLSDRIEFEKNKPQRSMIMNIREERYRIREGLDTSVSTLIQREIDKVKFVQNALQKAKGK